MTILVHCEDNILYNLKYTIHGYHRVLDIQQDVTVSISESAYKLSDYIYPPRVIMCCPNSIPNLQMLTRIALGEEFISEELDANTFPPIARAVHYRFVQQADMSNIITIHP